MNSFVRFVLKNGGHEYNIFYPQNLLKGEYSASNSSCVWFNDNILINSRLVSYSKIFQNENTKVADNNYMQTYFLSRDGFESRNVVSKFNNGNIIGTIESKYPDSAYDTYYRGFEDGRLVVWNNKLYIYGTRWDRSNYCGCICLYELDNNMQPTNEIIVQPQNSNGCEKNWGVIEDRPFTFIYNVNPTTVVEINQNGDCWCVKQNEKVEDLPDSIKGSTQVVRYDENTYISLVHRNDVHEDGDFIRTDYLTAFIFYDNDFNIKKISDWFVFKSPMCEFTCGLAIHGDDVYITYSHLDCTTNLIKTNKQTIEDFINLNKNLNDTYDFSEYYYLAKLNEDNNQTNACFSLYNYAATLYNDGSLKNTLFIESIIKYFCNVVNKAPTYRKIDLYKNIIESLNNIINKCPEFPEFYYLTSAMYKLDGNFDEYIRYKQMGDERKVNMHSYFFKYFNPNYL